MANPNWTNIRHRLGSRTAIVMAGTVGFAVGAGGFAAAQLAPPDDTTGAFTTVVGDGVTTSVADTIPSTLVDDTVVDDTVVDDPVVDDTVATSGDTTPATSIDLTVPTVPDNTIGDDATSSTVPDNTIDDNATNSTVPDNTIDDNATNSTVPDNTIDDDSSSSTVPDNTIDDDSSSSTVPDNTIDDDSSSSTVPDNTIDDDSSSSTVPDNTIVDDSSTARQLPGPFTETYQSAGGSISVSWSGSAFSIDSISPAAGFVADIEDTSWDKVRVDFENDDDDARIEVRLHDGQIRVRID